MSGRRESIAVATLTLVVWVIARQVLGPAPVQGDVRIAQRVGRMMNIGLVPYRDFDVDAPPAATGMFWLIHRLPGPPALTYWLVMGVALAIAAAATWAIATRLQLRPWRRLLATGPLVCAPLVTGSAIQSHSDVVLAALLACGLLAAVHARFGWMWTMLAAAAALWVMPLLLFPVAAIWHGTHRGRASASAAITAALGAIAATIVPFVLVAPEGMWQSLRRHLVRPMQVESLGASIIRGLGLPFRPVFGYGSDNVEGPGATALAIGLCLVAALVIVSVVRRTTRHRPTDRAMVAAFAATLVAATALGRTLPAPMVVVLIPAILVVPGRLGTASALIATAALLLTRLVAATFGHPLAVEPGPVPTAVLLARNLAFVLALVAANAAISHRLDHRREKPPQTA